MSSAAKRCGLRILLSAYACEPHKGSEPGVVLFEAGSSEDLARHLAWAETYPEKMRAMGENARAVYEAQFTSRENYGRLISIYEEALAAVRLKVAV